MDGLIFRYIPGSSVIHRFDPRLKLPVFAFVCYALLRGSPPGLLFILALLGASILAAGIPLKTLAVDFFRFLPLVGLLFAGVLFSGDGGLQPGPAGIAATRFALLILAGNTLVQTTCLESLKAAVAWFLKPVPLVNGGRIASMLGLTLGLLPRFFTELEESKDALKNRGLSPGRRPLRWTVFLIRPVLIRLFLRTEETVEAMESRCYTDTKVFPPMNIRPMDWIIFGIAVSASLSTILL